MTKKSRPKHRRRGFWRSIFRHYFRAARARLKQTAAAVAGPHEVARASQEWIDGEYVGLRPKLRAQSWRHYVAPDDLERYVVSLGGKEFLLELLPESQVEITKAAYQAAITEWGPYMETQPLDFIEADNDRAAAVLPQRITA